MAIISNVDKPMETRIPQSALDDMTRDPYREKQYSPIDFELVSEEGDGEEQPPEEDSIPFDANLADHMETTDLLKVCSDIVSMYDSDLMGRTEWERSYLKGLDLMGMKIEERSQPWPGAAGVYHPVLTEAVVRFQAQSMLECFPAGGPAMTTVIGKASPDKIKRAKRVADEVNYFITDRMPEFRTETEQMLFRLPLAGSAFKKVYRDPSTGRPVSCFVPAEDFVVPYGCSELSQAERYTHSMRKTSNEIKKYMRSGFYKTYDLPSPTPQFTNVDEKTAKLTGTRPQLDFDDRHHLIEMHVDYNIPGIDDEDGVAKPYVITIAKDADKVLSIRRNWLEGDPAETRIQYFVHYPYLPGLGFYGTGLIHLIGGLAKSATSILRQLIDGGTLSNLPAGFKARGLRIKSDDQNPLRPGEFRDVDVPGNAIKDSIYPLPIKEPSAVLFQLLGNVVDEARRIGSVADLKVTDLSSEAPVGTVLALLERSLKVMSGVQARLHAALKQELRLIYNIIGSMEGDYEYDQESNQEAGVTRAQDFANKVDIVPVSDPNASTMAQRVVQYQAAMEFSARTPDIYDLPKLHFQMLNVLGIKDAEDIVKMPDEIPMLDPVSENMAILTMKPTKAFLQQDHQAHIVVHMGLAQDPKIQEMVGQSPNAAVIQSAMAAHIAEHMAFEYRVQIEKMTGTPLPPPGQPLPDDVEANLSRLVAAASGKLLAQSKAQVAQAKAQEAAQDPLVQIEIAKLQNAKSEIDRKAAKDAIDARLREREMLGREKLDTARIAADLLTSAHQVQANQIAEKGRAATALVQTAAQTASQERIARHRAKTGGK